MLILQKKKHEFPIYYFSTNQIEIFSIQLTKHNSKYSYPFTNDLKKPQITKHEFPFRIHPIIGNRKTFSHNRRYLYTSGDVQGRTDSYNMQSSIRYRLPSTNHPEKNGGPEKTYPFCICGIHCFAMGNAEDLDK